MSIRQKLTLLIALLFAIAVGNAIFVYVLEAKSETKAAWVAHTHEVIDQNGRLLMAITDAQYGQRGYLLTSVPHYLEPYTSGIVEVENALARLRSMTADDAAQQTRLAELEELIEAKLAYLAESISLHDRDPEQALALVRTERGKNEMNEIRSLIARIESVETTLLEQRKSAYSEARAYITSAIIIQLLLMVALILALASTIRHQLFLPLGKLIRSIDQLQHGQQPSLSSFLPDDEMGYVISNFYQMSKVVHSNHEMLARQARLDELTGVRNRTALADDIAAAVNTARQRGEQMAVCFIDLDGLKPINDKLGHEAGDKLLLSFAERAVDAVRDSDSVYRHGGDEFVIVLTGFASRDALHDTVVKVLDKIRGEIALNGQMVPVAFSTGVAISPDHSDDADTLIQCADTAMYHAKRAREQGVQYFSPEMSSRASDRPAG